MVRASSTGIHPWMEKGDKLSLEVLIDERAVAAVDYAAPADGLRRTPATTFVCPDGMKKLSLKGKFEPVKGKAVSFNSCWNIFDLGPYTKPLYEPELSLSERFIQLSKRLDDFAEKTDHEYVNPLEMESVDSKTAVNGSFSKDLDSFLELITDYQISVGDSRFMNPEGIVSITDMLFSSEWSYEKSSLNSILSGETRSRYDRSYVFFQEVGDGLGALGWDPAGVTTGESTNHFVDNGSGALAGVDGFGVWFWLHQECLNEPRLLLDKELKPINSESAATNVLQRLALNADSFSDCIYEDELPEPFLVVDSSHPSGLIQINFDNSKKKPELMFRSYDYNFSII